MFNEDMVEDETLDIQNEEDTFTEEETTEDEEESVDDLKSRITKLEEEKENQKKRAEKAEQKNKVTKQPNEGTLSAKDLIALAKADIADEDFDEVLEYAKFKKVSIADALNSSVIKATLAEKTELRKSAGAVNTGAGRRAGVNISDEKLYADSKLGILPDSDADMERLAKLRLQRR